MDKKNIWIVANWKSNKNLSEALSWVSVVGPRVEKRPNLKVVVCPSFIDLEEVKKAVLVGNFPLLVGAQDLSEYDVGAHTGEEAAKLLKEFVDLAILGHSERRQGGETDTDVAKKVLMAKTHQIEPLVCLQNEQTPVPDQVSLVAFEPITAIGTGQPDTPDDANGVAKKIKQQVPGVEVLYGGSVTSENAKAFLQQDNLNGLLIGTAALDPEEFVKIVEVSYGV